MKMLKLIAGSALVVLLFNTAQAQDTTKTTRIISVDTTVVKDNSSNRVQKPVVNQPVTPVQTPAPVTSGTTNINEDNDDKNSYDQTGFHFGLRFQPGFSSISSSSYGNNAVKVSGSFGYGFGVGLSYYYNNYVSTQIELLYSQLAQKYKDGSNVNRSIDLQYFSIPVLMTFNTNYGRPVNFNVAVGPQLGILAGSKISGSDGNYNAVLAASPFDLGAAFGAGFDFGFGPKHRTHLNIGYRGVRGLIDIDNSNGSNVDANKYYILQKSKTNINSLYVGVRFKL